MAKLGVPADRCHLRRSCTDHLLVTLSINSPRKGSDMAVHFQSQHDKKVIFTDRHSSELVELG